MEATLAGISIGALIFGIIKSRQYSDTNNITTVIPPSLQVALKAYQNEPSKDNLKRLEQLKQQEELELGKVKKQAQDEANRKIAQIMEDAKAQAQRMYAQGKLEEAKNIERLAQLKRTTIQEDTQANLQELAKRFQGTMTTINTMMTNAQLTSDKNLEKQIAAVTNELRTARNNEAILRNQVSQLQAQLKNASSINPRQTEEMRITIENAKRCSYEADMLKRELFMLKAASNGDQNAMRISSQFAELRRQLDEAKRNEQQLLFQLQNERMRKNSGANASSRYRIQQLESELNNLRLASTSNSGKDMVIRNLQHELEMAQRRERDAVQQLEQMRSASYRSDGSASQQRIYDLERQLEQLRRVANNPRSSQSDGFAAQQRIYDLERQLAQTRNAADNARRSQSNGFAAQQHIYELERQLANLTSNANNKVTDMAREISQLKNKLQFYQDEYSILKKEMNATTLKQDKNASMSNSALLNNARNEIRDLKMKLQNISLAGNAKPNEARSALKIADLEAELKRAKLDNRPSTDIEEEIRLLKKQSSPDTQQLASVLVDLNNRLEQARASEMEAKKALRNANTSDNDTIVLKTQLAHAESEAQKLRDEINNMKKAALIPAASMAQAEEIATVQQKLEQHSNNSSDLSQALENAKLAQDEVKRLREQVSELEKYKQRVNELEDELSVARLQTPVPQSDAFQGPANEVIYQVVQQANSQRDNAQNTARQLLNQANVKVVNASSNTNVNDLKRQLEKAKNDAQQIESIANAKYASLLQTTEQLQQQLMETKKQFNALQSETNKIKDFANANSARRQLNDVVSNFTQQMTQNAQSSNAGLDDCLKQVATALRDAKMDMSKVEQFILDVRSDDPNLQEEIKQLRQVLEIKNKALLEAEKVQDKTNVLNQVLIVKQNEFTNSKPPEAIIQIVKNTQEKVDKIVETAKTEVAEVVNNNMVCPLRNCPTVKTEISCGETMPKVLDNFTDDVYQTFHKRLQEYKTKLYATNDTSPYLNPLNAGYGTDKNEYGMSLINQDALLNKHNNLFVPLINTGYSPTKDSEKIKNQLDTSCMGIYKTLLHIKDYITKLKVEVPLLHSVDTVPLPPENTKPEVILEMLGRPIINLYITIIRTILNSPVTFKFTSLYTSKIQELLKPDKFPQLQLLDTMSTGTIYRPFFLKVMYKFLYVDITSLLQLRNNSQISSFYDSHLRQYEDKIVLQDTINCAQILMESGVCSQRYLYIERFLNSIDDAFKSNSLSTKIFNVYMLLYIAYNLPFMIAFIGYIYKNVEDETNSESLTKFLDEVILEKLNANVLTYVKVRKDDEKTQYNGRFRVFVNKGKNTQPNTVLLVKYNEHNFPYYMKTKEGTIVPDTNLKSNYQRIYAYPGYDSVFKMRNNELYLDHYQEEYLLGPFTRIFNHEKTNGEVAVDMTEVKTHLSSENPRPVFLIGYGASGAGKTSTLIYFNKPEDPRLRNGVLMHLCKELAVQFPNILVKCYEVFNKVDKASIEQQDIKYELGERESETLHFQYNGTDQFVLVKDYVHKNKFSKRVEFIYPQQEDCRVSKFQAGKSTLGEVLIHMIDVDRFVKATTNNPNSSRSHTIIFVKFGNKEGYYNEKRTLIIGDFAGVENTFDCKDERQLLGFLRVKEDKPNGKAFYSREDPSLYGAEGGMRKRAHKARKTRLNNSRTLIGGKLERGCDFVRENDTPDFFELGKSNFRSNKKQIPEINEKFSNVVLREPKYTYKVDNEILSLLFNTKENYAMYLKNILETVLLVNGVTTDQPLKYLTQQPQSVVMQMFAKYMQHEEGFNKFLENTKTFRAFMVQLQNRQDKHEFVRDTLFKNIKGCCGLQEGETFHDFMQIASAGFEIEKPLSRDVMADLGKDWGQKTITTTLGQAHHVLFSNSPNPNLQDRTSYSRKTFPAHKHFGWVTLDYSFKGITNAKAFLEEFTKSTKTVQSTKTQNMIPDLVRVKLIRRPAQTSDTQNYDMVTVKPSAIYEKMKAMFVGPFYTYLGFQLGDKFNAATIVSQLTKSALSKTGNDDKVIAHNERIDLLTRIFEKYNETTLRDFCIAFVKEAFDIILEMMCRKSYYEHICKVRRQEGYFINSSLNEIRELIKDIMYEKNKDSINISPLFHKPCLPAYCEKTDCFSMTVQKKSVKSLVFNIIVKELAPDKQANVQKNLIKTASVLQDLVIGVFVVINLSSMANNPPPVPYIDTNSVRVALGETGYVTNRLIAECRRLKKRLKELTFNGVAVKLEIPEDISNNINAIAEQSNVQNRSTTKTDKDSLEVDNLITSLEYLEKVSAASLIGTLHYADALAKFNTTQAICTQYILKNMNIDAYEALLDALSLKDIADTAVVYQSDKEQGNNEEGIKKQEKRLGLQWAKNI